jgi:FPC/CPF motif-containing protein YcgG
MDTIRFVKNHNINFIKRMDTFGILYPSFITYYKREEDLVILEVDHLKWSFKRTLKKLVKKERAKRVIIETNRNAYELEHFNHNLDYLKIKHSSLVFE